MSITISATPDTTKPVVITSSPAGFEEYEWFMDGSAIDGSNVANFVATRSGAYYVAARTGLTWESSNVLDVTVDPVPSATYSITVYGEAQPGAINVSKGATVIFDVLSDDGSELDVAQVSMTVLRSGAEIADLSIVNGVVASDYVAIADIEDGVRISINDSETKYKFKSGALIEINVVVTV